MGTDPRANLGQQTIVVLTKAPPYEIYPPLYPHQETLLTPGILMQGPGSVVISHDLIPMEACSWLHHGLLVLHCLLSLVK